MVIGNLTAKLPVVFNALYKHLCTRQSSAPLLDVSVKYNTVILLFWSTRIPKVLSMCCEAGMTTDSGCILIAYDELVLLINNDLLTILPGILRLILIIFAILIAYSQLRILFYC